jgi:bud site selection protein 31
MPKVRIRRRAPPAGFDVLEETLNDIERQMRDAEADTANGKRAGEMLWPLYRLHHQRSRFVYEQFYKAQAISRDVYDYCLREKIADADLIAKWKKAGYECLCCLKCANVANHQFGTTCVCRVPKKDRDAGAVECTNCGCRGCASGD